jgi:isopenicillin-N epimerase
VTSHGWNDPRAHQGERGPFRLRFDWTGTGDPTPALALADAIGLVAALEPGGWPAIMAANRELVLRGRDVVAAALGIEPPAPDAMIGSMAALPVRGLTTDDDAQWLHHELLADGIEVPVHGWPVPAGREPGTGPRAILLRLSAQRYNDEDDFERLADALSRRLARSAAR